MGQKPDDATAALASEDASSKPLDSADVGQETGSGGIPTDLTKEPSMASPRSIPAPACPPFPVQLPPEPAAEDTGPVSSSFDRKCAPPEAPVTDTTSYDQLAYGQLHALCKKESYH